MRALPAQHLAKKCLLHRCDAAQTSILTLSCQQSGEWMHPHLRRFTITHCDVVQADLSKRYGCLANGAADIKTHAWFKGTDWASVARREDLPPIRCPAGPNAF